MKCSGSVSLKNIYVYKIQNYKKIKLPSFAVMISSLRSKSHVVMPLSFMVEKYSAIFTISIQQ